MGDFIYDIISYDAFMFIWSSKIREGESKVETVKIVQLLLIIIWCKMVKKTSHIHRKSHDLKLFSWVMSRTTFSQKSFLCSEPIPIKFLEMTNGHSFIFLSSAHNTYWLSYFLTEIYFTFYFHPLCIQPRENSVYILHISSEQFGIF